jgi:ribosome biogenesis GTPase
VELLALSGDTWVADTPGFSLLDAQPMDPQRLKEFYPEMRPYEKDCRFLSCNHIGEPVCGVKRGAPGRLDCTAAAGTLRPAV